MKLAVRIALGLLALVLLAGAGMYTWATMRSSSLGSRVIETHAADFPVPFPLSPDELATLSEGEDPDAVALERAIERGRHLVEARYACIECHGQDFGGGVMVEDPLLGALLGPNITGGSGSKVLSYDAADWDRAVRHGVKPDGTPSIMPAEDFQLMSDQELSDIVAYILSVPAVDNEVPEPSLGPLGRVLVAAGELPFSADLIESHTAAHPELPPATEVSVEFGAHLAGVCSGCHHADFSGGAVPGGDPSWPQSANLTPHEDGLAGWDYTDFRRLMLEGVRPDGTEVVEPMTLIEAYAANMTDVEMEALWMYLESLPPVASTD